MQRMKIFRRSGLDHKFPAFLLYICFVGVLVSCSEGVTVPHTATIQMITPTVKQITPTPEEPMGNDQTQQQEDMRMIFIPSNVFEMGSTQAEIEAALDLCQQHYHICNRWYYDRESPVHTVSLDGYWIDFTEVSNEQYRLCVEAGECSAPSTCKKGEPTFENPNMASHPVVCVNWEEARNYCQWAGARLPTEAEWEYAFRGEDRSIYPWGDAFDGSRLNYCDQNCSQNFADEAFDDGYPLTAPTGSYPAGVSWSGVLNMGGKVSEWVSDWFEEFTAGSISNPAGPISGTEKLIKGCSWFNHPTYCRGAARHSVDPDTRFDYLGFRCASDLPISSGSKLNHQVTTSETISSTAEPKISDSNFLEATALPETDKLGGEQLSANGLSLFYALASDKQIGSDEMDLVAVPTGNPPIIDGTISPGEWDGAVDDSFTDGSEIRFIQAGEYIYLSIRAINPETIAANVFIQQDDHIKILHTSAALGTAKYLESDQRWQKIQDFTWRCRSTSDSQSAQDERDDFLWEEDWVAANGRMGTPNELEYQIKIPDQDFHMAVVYIKTSYPYDKISWPGILDDDCVQPSQGGLPDEMRFSPNQWTLFKLIDP